MPKKPDTTPENGFYDLVENTNSEIKAIRKRALDEISEVKKHAGALALKEFASLCWNKWTEEDLTAEGQFERLEESIIDPHLELVKLYFQTNSADIADSKGMYRVSGEVCECADFVFNGLPCKHMYFLAGILIS